MKSGVFVMKAATQPEVQSAVGAQDSTATREAKATSGFVSRKNVDLKPLKQVGYRVWRYLSWMTKLTK
ncbi:hypothetical protein FXN63_18810 [Pigmentiphaga aceris]|uniref:Uncharacterized protein n=1 Tax=Pigmentiphaga aceris TaxID=1940612 RepID=A0A5C0B4D0_9BURK|nr:hypothetical protein [Pigmentiphaga aceris]QEI07661.1 hypothetical protein FXN63_18810 [Pigmentiphaga aceris]